MRISKPLQHNLHLEPVSPWVDMCYLGLVLIIFYSLWLGSFPLFTPDEARYSEIAREMVASGDYLTPRVNGVPFFDKPVLYYWLQAGAIRWLGMREWALRFFPLLIGVGGCLLVYASGRYLFDRRTGLIAGSILAMTPLYFASAHYADLNLEVAVFISAALFCFLCAYKNYDQHNSLSRSCFYLLITAFFFAGIAVLTKGMIGLVFPFLIVGSWMLLRRRFYWMAWPYVIGACIFALVVLPWYVLVQKTHPVFFHYFFVVQHVGRFLSQGEFNNKMPIWFYVPVIIGGFFPWSIFLLQTLSKSIKAVLCLPKQHEVELYLLLWAGIVLVFFSLPQSKLIGYILPVFPPLALLVGRYLSQAWETANERMLRSSCLYLAGLSGTMACLLWLLSYKGWLDFSSELRPYLWVMGVVCLMVAIGALILLRQKRLPPVLYLCLASTAVCLLLLVKGAVYLNQNTAKPAAMYLSTILKPQDEVVMYYKYYYDVPLYLQRRLAVVADWEAKDILQKDNWMREFWLGRQIEDTRAWLLNEEVFWQKWAGKTPIYVFININYLPQFKKRAEYYFVLARHNDIFLLSNSPLRVSKLKGVPVESLHDGAVSAA